MPYELVLPKKLKARGWKVKIREKERLEPPHVTVFHGENLWRISLRDWDFLLPPGGRWKEIDDELRVLLGDETRREELRDAWNRIYPSNPVSSQGEDDDA